MIGFANMSVEAVDHGGVNRGHRTGTPPIVCTVTPEPTITPNEECFVDGFNFREDPACPPGSMMFDVLCGWESKCACCDTSSQCDLLTNGSVWQGSAIDCPEATSTPTPLPITPTPVSCDLTTSGATCYYQCPGYGQSVFCCIPGEPGLCETGCPNQMNINDLIPNCMKENGGSQ